MVNVLISTYNGEKYIKEQLDSLLEQTYWIFHIQRIMFPILHIRVFEDYIK